MSSICYIHEIWARLLNDLTCTTSGYCGYHIARMMHTWLQWKWILWPEGCQDVKPQQCWDRRANNGWYFSWTAGCVRTILSNPSLRCCPASSFGLSMHGLWFVAHFCSLHQNHLYYVSLPCSHKLHLGFSWFV